MTEQQRQKEKEREDNAIIKECQEFLMDSSTAFSTDMSRQTEQLEMFGGNFWTPNVMDKFKRNKNRLNLHFSNWETQKNAAVSPFSRSPYHIALCTDKEGDENEIKELQDAIDNFEADMDCKSSYEEALGRCYVCGSGFYVLGVEPDEMTGENKIIAEFVTRQASVAFDPSACAVDGSDAEQGAIVNYIPTRKAKRLYGDGIVPIDYPNSAPTLSFTDVKQWPDQANKVQIVTYYRKKVSDEEGAAPAVEWFKICGNAIVDRGELPIRYIPIVRFSGYQVYRNGEISYTGIVDKTFDLQLGVNIGYSSLIGRAGRSVKANYIVNTDSIVGLDEYYKKMNDDDSLLVMYKGDKAPIPIQESFVTSDLTEMIQNTRNLITDVSGIPLTGVPGLNENEKTATEVLVQQVSTESNQANFYTNAYKATRTIGRIVIELLTGGVDLKFSLENGPAVISQAMKKRQEISAVAGLVPENLKPLLAIHYLDTIKTDESKKVKSDIIANLPPEMRLVSEQPTDPAAIHELERMKAVCDGLAEQMDALKAENEELKKQYETAELSMLDGREARNQDFKKFMISETNKMNIETAKLESTNAKSAADLAIKNKEVNAKLQEAADDTERAAIETAQAIGGQYGI